MKLGGQAKFCSICSMTNLSEIQLFTHWITPVRIMFLTHTQFSSAIKGDDYFSSVIRTQTIWFSVFGTGPLTWFTATISLMPQQNKVLFHVFVFFSLVILHLSYCKYPGGDFTSKGILSLNKRKKIVVIRNCRVEQPVTFIFIDLEHCRASF